MQDSDHRGPPGFSNETLTARELNVTVRTLRKWRQLQIGPPWTEVGRQIFYSDNSRATWLKKREIQPARDQAAQRKSDAA